MFALNEDVERQIATALRGVDCVVALFVRDPGGDPECDDVRIYVAVRPFGQASIEAVRQVLLPVTDIDGIVVTYIHDEDRLYRAMLVGAREIFRR